MSIQYHRADTARICTECGCTVRDGRSYVTDSESGATYCGAECASRGLEASVGHRQPVGVSRDYATPRHSAARARVQWAPILCVAIGALSLGFALGYWVTQ